jgi:hypothetical protein
MLGFDVSERTISRWMQCAPRQPEPGQGWLAFLRSRSEAIAAMDLGNKYHGSETIASISSSVKHLFSAFAGLSWPRGIFESMAI